MAPRSNNNSGLSSSDANKQIASLLASLRMASCGPLSSASDQTLLPSIIHNTVLTDALERNEASPEVRALAIDLLLQVTDLPQAAGLRFVVCIQAELRDRHHSTSLLAALRALPALARPLLIRLVRSPTFEADAKSCLTHPNPIVRQASIRSLSNALLHLHFACFGRIGFEEIVCDTPAERAALVEDTKDMVAVIWKAISDCCFDVDDLVASQAFSALVNILDEPVRASILSTTHVFLKHVWATPPASLPSTEAMHGAAWSLSSRLIQHLLPRFSQLTTRAEWLYPTTPPIDAGLPTCLLDAICDGFNPPSLVGMTAASFADDEYEGRAASSSGGINSSTPSGVTSTAAGAVVAAASAAKAGASAAATSASRTRSTLNTSNTQQDHDVNDTTTTTTTTTTTRTNNDISTSGQQSSVPTLAGRQQQPATQGNDSDAASPYIGLATTWANVSSAHLSFLNALTVVAALARAALEGQGSGSKQLNGRAGHPLVNRTVELETVPGDHASGVITVSARSLAANLIDTLLLPPSSSLIHAMPVCLEATQAAHSLLQTDPGVCALCQDIPKRLLDTLDILIGTVPNASQQFDIRAMEARVLSLTLDVLDSGRILNKQRARLFGHVLARASVSAVAVLSGSSDNDMLLLLTKQDTSGATRRNSQQQRQVGTTRVSPTPSRRPSSILLQAIPELGSFAKSSSTSANALDEEEWEEGEQEDVVDDDGDWNTNSCTRREADMFVGLVKRAWRMVVDIQMKEGEKQEEEQQQQQQQQPQHNTDIISSILTDEHNPVALLWKQASYSEQNKDDAKKNMCTIASASLVTTLLFSTIQYNLEQATSNMSIQQIDMSTHTMTLTWSCLLWSTYTMNERQQKHHHKWPWVHHIAAFARLLAQTNKAIREATNSKDGRNVIANKDGQRSQNVGLTSSDSNAPLDGCFDGIGNGSGNVTESSEIETTNTSCDKLNAVVGNIVNAQPLVAFQTCESDVGVRLVWVLANVLVGISGGVRQEGQTSSSVAVATGVVSLIGQLLLDNDGNENSNSSNSTLLPVLLDCIVRVCACFPNTTEHAQSVLIQLAQRPDLSAVSREYGRSVYERLYALEDPVIGAVLRTNVLATQVVFPPPLLSKTIEGHSGQQQEQEQHMWSEQVESQQDQLAQARDPLVMRALPDTTQPSSRWGRRAGDKNVSIRFSGHSDPIQVSGVVCLLSNTLSLLLTIENRSGTILRDVQVRVGTIGPLVLVGSGQELARTITEPMVNGAVISQAFSAQLLIKNEEGQQDDWWVLEAMEEAQDVTGGAAALDLARRYLVVSLMLRGQSECLKLTREEIERRDKTSSLEENPATAANSHPVSESQDTENLEINYTPWELPFDFLLQLCTRATNISHPSVSAQSLQLAMPKHVELTSVTSDKVPRMGGWMPLDALHNILEGTSKLNMFGCLGAVCDSDVLFSIDAGCGSLSRVPMPCLSALGELEAAYIGSTLSGQAFAVVWRCVKVPKLQQPEEQKQQQQQQQWSVELEIHCSSVEVLVGMMCDDSDDDDYDGVGCEQAQTCFMSLCGAQRTATSARHRTTWTLLQHGRCKHHHEQHNHHNHLATASDEGLHSSCPDFRELCLRRQRADNWKLSSMSGTLLEMTPGAKNPSAVVAADNDVSLVDGLAAAGAATRNIDVDVNNYKIYDNNLYVNMRSDMNMNSSMGSGMNMNTNMNMNIRNSVETQVSSNAVQRWKALQSKRGHASHTSCPTIQPNEAYFGAL